MQGPCAGELTSDDGRSLIDTAIGRAFDRSPSLELAFTLPESGLLVGEVENGEVIETKASALPFIAEVLSPAH
jgi:hypothetical protein